MNALAKLILIPFAASIWALAAASPAVAQEADGVQRSVAGLDEPSVWDLEFGAHATQFSTARFIDFACGTRGGPPSLPIPGWTEFRRCPQEPDTGFYEVYFQYDDEPEYIARALKLQTRAAMFQYTSAYAIPVIVTALFDPQGFYVGFRMVTDPRVDTALRERGAELSGYLTARYGGAEWACEDLPPREGERPYQGAFRKQQCVQTDEAAGLALFFETHLMRKPGQFAVNPANGLPTEGQFESTTHFEAILTRGVPDPEGRLAELQAQGPSEQDLLVQRALDCPGCDFEGANFKRANLRGANLEGANLAGATLHGAILAGANLAGANLVEANLNRADLKQANLDGANLESAMLFEARLDGASLQGARLQGGFAGKVQMIRANLQKANLSDLDLREARLNDADFRGANINLSYLESAQLARANLANANIVQTSLRYAGMVEVDLSNADVRGTDLFRANLRGANLTGADFTRARLSNANMAETRSEGAIFFEALLPPGFVPDG